MTLANIDFRGTAGYVTDASGCTYCVGDTYPVTRGGSTFGWGAIGVATADRSTGVDPRLAGINFSNGTVPVFTYDLPSAGSYDIRLAIGDASFAQATDYISVYDDTTLLFTVNGATPSDDFFDAVGNTWSGAAWPGSNVAVTATFASTKLVLKLNPLGTSGFYVISHLGVAASGGGGTTSATGTATASASASGVGASVAKATGTASAAATASGTGASKAAATGTAIAGASASGVSSLSGATTGTAIAGATAAGVGASIVKATGTASATASASGVGASVAKATGTATATSSASGIGDFIAAGSSIGTAIAGATASGVGGAIVSVIGTAIAGASVLGVGGFSRLFAWVPATTSTTDWTVQNDNPVTWTIADD